MGISDPVIVDLRPRAVRALDAVEHSRWGAALAVLGAAYDGGARLRDALRAQVPLKFPPRSLGVGNLRVGGTGKTPVVDDLARRLSRDQTVHVLARGYRSEGGGDEPDWLRGRGLPVHLDSDRRRAHAAARAAGAELVVLDDSLQTRFRPQIQLALLLERDLNHPPRALPAGPAREGVWALRRADALCVRIERDWPADGERWKRLESAARHHCTGPLFAFRLAPVDWHGPEGEAVALEQAPGDAAVIVSGLARPQSFERDVLGLGCRVRRCVRLSDHASFDEREAARIRAEFRAADAAVVIVPEKNRVRLEAAAPELPLWSLRSCIEWSPDPLDWLREELRRLP